MLSSRLRFPTRKRKVTINTDGNEQNIGGIRKHFHVESVDYSRRKKIRNGQKIIGVVSEIIANCKNLQTFYLQFAILANLANV